MIIYIMRHAEAVEASDKLKDEWRYLTAAGRDAATKCCSAVSKAGPKARLTITSPLTRAVQTAEIASGYACRKNTVVASELLLPGADLDELIAYITGCGNKRVMLVGHEPQLGNLVAALLGRSDVAVTLKKGACVALEINPEKGEANADFLWYLVPGKKRCTSFKKAFHH